MKKQHLYPIILEARAKSTFENEFDLDKFHDTFADLVIQKCMDELKREWYRENNKPKEPNETPRDIGIRVGKKSSLIQAINKLDNLMDKRCVYCINDMPYYDQACPGCLCRM